MLARFSHVCTIQFLLAGFCGAVALALGLGVATTQPVEDRFAGGLVGSPHDFSRDGAARDLCLPCHTPHISATQAPLLIASGGATTQPARSYPTPAGSLDAASLVCLSCHDGTVARDVYAGAHAMSWSDLSGRSLRRDEVRVTNHPVGVKYPDGERAYHSAATVERDGRIKLPGGRIQCTTCHDPHNRGNHGSMLVISNDRSRLCLSCHNL
ncbi:MAG: hypothetical protein JNG88_13415 [Phycisphaerales bacterium]|nr:hypothetical protein [Phycisphaerales bacterium]